MKTILSYNEFDALMIDEARVGWVHQVYSDLYRPATCQNNFGSPATIRGCRTVRWRESLLRFESAAGLKISQVSKDANRDREPTPALVFLKGYSALTMCR